MGSQRLLSNEHSTNTELKSTKSGKPRSNKTNIVLTAACVVLLAACGNDFFDIGKNCALPCIIGGEEGAGHTNTVYDVALSADGNTIVSGSKDKTIRRWNANSGKPIGEPLIGHANAVRSLALSADGNTIVSGSWDRTIRLWNAQTGDPISGALKGHTNYVNAVTLSADGTTIVSGGDTTIRRWNTTTGL